MHDERPARLDQLETHLQIAPGRRIVVVGIDENDVEHAPLLPDFREAITDVVIATAVIDTHAVVMAIRAAIDEPTAGQEFRPIDLGVTIAGRPGT